MEKAARNRIMQWTKVPHANELLSNWLTDRILCVFELDHKLVQLVYPTAVRCKDELAEGRPPMVTSSVQGRKYKFHGELS